MQVYVLQPLTPLGNLAESGIVSTSASLRCRLPRFPPRLAARARGAWRASRSLRSLAARLRPAARATRGSLAARCAR